MLDGQDVSKGITLQQFKKAFELKDNDFAEQFFKVSRDVLGSDSEGDG